MAVEPRSVAKQNPRETATFGNQGIRTATGVLPLPPRHSALFRSLEDVLSLNITFHSSLYLALLGVVKDDRAFASFFLISISFSVPRLYSKPRLMFLNHPFSKIRAHHAIQGDLALQGSQLNFFPQGLLEASPIWFAKTLTPLKQIPRHPGATGQAGTDTD